MEAQLIEKQAVNATFKVTVPAAEVDAAFDAVLSSLSRQVRVPGFRPGKAPRGVLVRRVGQEAVANEVREALVDANYPKAVKELELMPVHAHFHPEELSEGSSFVFEVHAELYPDIKLPDIDGIVIDAGIPELTDDMVADAVQQLRSENATLVPVDRAIEPSDYVLIESVADQPETPDADAALEPAASADGSGVAVGSADGSGVAVAEPVGTGSVTPVDMENASEQVREQLIGKSMGDLIELRLTDDVKTQAELDAGDTEPTVRVLRTIVRDVKAKEKPEADDEFARTLGMDQWDEVLERVRENIAERLQRDGFEAQREEFVDKLVVGSDFEVPTTLVNRRQRNLLQELADDLRRQGTTLDRYVQRLDEAGTREEFETELNEAALKGVKRDLVLETLLERRGTELSDAEFDAAVRHLAMRQQRDVSRFKREMGEDWLANYRFRLRRDKALRETVRELVGGVAPEDEAQDAAEEVAEQTGKHDEADDGNDGHGDDAHDHDDRHDRDHRHEHDDRHD